MIKSSFKKVEKSSNNSQRCFFGHPQLDAVLSNSLSKGHVIAIQEDHPTTHYLALARCFLSQHYSQDLISVVFDNTMRWKHLLSPTLKKIEKPLEEASKSQIAWRYDTMVIKHSTLPVDERIPLVDLSKEVTDPDPKLLQLHQYPTKTPKQVYHSVEEAIVSAQTGEKDFGLKKLLLASLPAYLYKDAQFPEFLKAIKCLTRSTHTLTLITIPSILPPSAQKTLIKHVDYYLKLGQIGKGFGDFTGTLSLQKQMEVGSLRSNFRGPSVWGLKSGKRQLQIQSLYEEAVEGETEEKKNDF